MNKEIINLINTENKKVLNKLENEFNVNFSMISNDSYIGICPVGIEIEVKWKDYFPTLSEKYFKGRKFSDLEQDEREALTQECYLLEDKLLPILEKVTNCGIEKGADKYWEFAFPPTSDTKDTVKQIEVLNNIRAIPEGKHSLHLTIGGINNNKDTYYLLLLLESLFCDKDRLQSAFNKEHKELSSTWARKGMGGVFLKDDKDLKYDFTVASELRTLELKIDNNIEKSLQEVEQILLITSKISDLIYFKNNDLDFDSNEIKQSYIEKLNKWEQWRTVAECVLKKNSLADENWKKPNLSPQYWNTYIENFDTISEDLKFAYNDILKEEITKEKENSITLSKIIKNKMK